MATLGLTRGPVIEILALGALELHISTFLSLVDSINVHFSLVQAVDLAVSCQP